MHQFVKQFWNDEGGFVLSAELVIILTVAVLAMIVGLSYVQTAVVSEFSDIGTAISSLNQSYSYSGYYSRSYFGKFKAFYSGSCYFNYPRGGAVLGYNSCNVVGNGGYYGGNTGGTQGSYSRDLVLEPEVVDQPCEICKPGTIQEDVIEGTDLDCPGCVPGEEKVIPEPQPSPTPNVQQK
ncbi:MAG: Flp family type IVb pilin [Planctomycetaceae bacterium]|nr:Flp family type IVb pilin [Planctomycetaceae bacterium]